MRITNVKEVEQKVVSGGEPDFVKTPDLHLSIALNWYSYYKDLKDSKNYLVSYMVKQNYTKQDIAKISKVSDSFISNTGFVCRLLERGAGLSVKQISWIENKINEFLKMADTTKDAEKDVAPKVNIQERIQEQSSEFIGELEGYLDTYKEKFSPYEWMNSNGVKAAHARKIVSHFLPKLTEPVLVMSGKADEELLESYNCFSKVEIKKYVNFIQQIIDDANRIVSNSNITRKPRKVKKPSSEKLVSKMQYKKDDVEYKIVSINPSDIIGAKQLWVFNTKTRRLGVYYAWTQAGLTVKGTSIHDFTDNSSSKTLRKPNDVLQTLVKATERKYENTFKEIKASEQSLTGRINTDTILLKVFK